MKIISHDAHMDAPTYRLAELVDESRRGRAFHSEDLVMGEETS
jgi:hypothetical protein